MLRRRTVPIVSLFCLMAVLVGCKDPYAGRQEISGTVTLEGKPLDTGQIFFLPLEKGGNESGCGIEEGAFKMPREHGLKPGKYLVRITSGDGVNPADKEAAGPGGSTNIVSIDRIPDEWNNKSTQKVDVTSGASNKFTFDIPKANSQKGVYRPKKK